MSLIEDREQPFGAFVIETLARHHLELARKWAGRAEFGAVTRGEPSDDGETPACAAEDVVHAVLTAVRDDGRPSDVLSRAGRAVGIEAHHRGAPLQQVLEELDALQEVLLHAAERTAATSGGDGTGHEALAVARCISRAVSSLRLAAVEEYAHAMAGELRERYRAIRHDLRNPLGTIRSAVALLADESVPPEMRETARIRAMVVRNARSLDQMIGQVLGDDAARLSAFGALADATASGRKQLDDLARPRERPDLQSGAL
jgi:signal transduction histidine kinase